MLKTLVLPSPYSNFSIRLSQSTTLAAKLSIFNLQKQNKTLMESILFLPVLAYTILDSVSNIASICHILNPLKPDVIFFVVVVVEPLKKG